MMTYTEWKKTGKRSQKVTVSANESYLAHRAEIDAKLARLQAALAKMDEGQAEAPNDWGWAGNAQHVAEAIDEALGFVEDSDENSNNYWDEDPCPVEFYPPKVTWDDQGDDIF